MAKGWQGSLLRLAFPFEVSFLSTCSCRLLPQGHPLCYVTFPQIFEGFKPTSSSPNTHTCTHSCRLPFINMGIWWVREQKIHLFHSPYIKPS